MRTPPSVSIRSVLDMFTVAAAFLPIAATQKQLPNYSPVRPPAIPLAVRSPYTSGWSSTASDGTLNGGTPSFWQGDSLGWEGIVVVDGNAYEYMGAARSELPELPFLNSSVPLDVKFDSQYSNFTFAAGPVTITASFFSPVTPKDTCRTSIPLSYLTTSIQSNDGQPHRIHFYTDVNAAWLGETSDQDIVWDLKKGALPVNGTENATNSPDDVFSWIYSRKVFYFLGEDNDYPQWGNFSYSTSPMGAGNFSFQSGYATAVRLDFVNNRLLNDNIHDPFYGFGDREPVFAFAHDVGVVMQSSVRYTIGSIQDPVIRYIHGGGVSNLDPWWKHCYQDIYSMIHFHWDDFYTVSGLGNAFEAQLRADIDTFYEGQEPPVFTNSTPTPPPYGPNGTDQYGQSYVFDPSSAAGFLDSVNSTGIGVPYVSEAQSYYAIVALSARQIMGAYAFAVPPGITDPSASVEPLMFQKEISSNGNVNTVDVLYPAAPFFLYANPDLLRFALQPLYEFQETDFYPNGYSIHDIGARFPNATGHVEGTDEYMPVEESANMILMSYAYYKFTGDVAWLTSHYALLKQFTQYLIQFTLVPEAQLSTDDFAGTLHNQTNLAIKGIVGLQAMSAVSQLAGDAYDALNFSTTARAYYAEWERLAVDPSGRHTTLGYQWRSSWGLLYNVFFDKLLNMGLVAPSLYAMQSDWYPSVSQAFGVPLDSRHHYTKSDWEVWAAATCSPPTRRLLVNSIAYWLNETSTERPFSDLFEVVSTGYFPEVPNRTVFSARPVAGGHFALLALGKTGQRAGLAAGDTTGSLFPKNGTEPLPAPDDPIPPQPSDRPVAARKYRPLRRVVTAVSSTERRTGNGTLPPRGIY